MGLEFLVEAEGQKMKQEANTSKEDRGAMNNFDGDRPLSGDFGLGFAGDIAMDWGLSDDIVDPALNGDLENTWLFSSEVLSGGLSNPIRSDEPWYPGSAGRHGLSSFFLESTSDSGPSTSTSQLNDQGLSTNLSRYPSISEGDIADDNYLDYQEAPSIFANPYPFDCGYGVDGVLDSDLFDQDAEIDINFWDQAQSASTATFGPNTQPPPSGGPVDFGVLESQPFRADAVLPPSKTDASAPDERPLTSSTRRAPGRPAGRPSATTIQPGSRPGRRPYRGNRQRVPLERVRRRIKCNIDGCEYEYATPGTVYRHRQNTHWSKSEFCARCLYPGCPTELWAGTEPKAWDNLKTHQNHKHATWISGKTRRERCEMTEHSRAENRLDPAV
ncbi:hypothetical protein TWF569_006871 [Orbilia oligospora]|nr:hypothetical protein TWF706_006035 [Orbilia oligospora]KAF3135007.1 hypothetical protein TWF594_008616 [Orbilia oligospora]KAF3156290.1 hypothetical protein TWF569_006871 [Orbilia oligospora]